MRFATALAVAAAIPAFVSAQNTITIQVGPNGTLAYDPPSATAAVGDKITFVFEAKNHTVTQSSFAEPCTKASINGVSGFASGFQPVAPNATEKPSFSINVTTTGPIWYYCGQKIPANHCQAGMVGVINAPPNATFDQFKAAAIASGNSSSSGTPSSPYGSASGSASTPSSTGTKSGAMRLSGSGAAGLLTFVGVVAGLTL